MPEFDKDERGVMHLDGDKEEVAVMITNDGQVTMIETFPTPEEPQEQPPHAWLAEGICKAITNPNLFEELQDLCRRAHAASEEIETQRPPMLQ